MFDLKTSDDPHSMAVRTQKQPEATFPVLSLVLHTVPTPVLSLSLSLLRDYIRTSNGEVFAVEGYFLGQNKAFNLRNSRFFSLIWYRYPPFLTFDQQRMIDDRQLGLFANFLGIFIFVLAIAYHYVIADPKYEGNLNFMMDWIAKMPERQSA
ncbi:unnamed protein product [Ilex paraguariensis]|uniref:Uncharacterized protein n=1 Tax=Ilex paraguariensis TaxID=185542 RepID=A0ABC8SFY3_9AQUA